MFFRTNCINKAEKYMLKIVNHSSNMLCFDILNEFYHHTTNNIDTFTSTIQKTINVQLGKFKRSPLTVTRNIQTGQQKTRLHAPLSSEGSRIKIIEEVDKAKLVEGKFRWQALIANSQIFLLPVPHKISDHSSCRYRDSLFHEAYHCKEPSSHFWVQDKKRTPVLTGDECSKYVPFLHSVQTARSPIQVIYFRWYF